MSEIDTKKWDKGLKERFFWMSVSAVVTIANSVAVWMVMARLRPIEEVGRFSVAMGVYALFFSFVSLGLMPLMVREIGRSIDNDVNVKRVVGSFSRMLGVSGVVQALIMTLSAFAIFGFSVDTASVAILSLGILPSGLIAVAEAYAIATNKTRTIAMVTFVENALRTILPILLIWSESALPAVCLGFAAVRYVALALYIASLRLPVLGGSKDLTPLHSTLQAGSVFAATILLASAILQTPIVVLGFLAPESESAIYGIASRFFVPAAVVLSTYAASIQPSLTFAFLETPERIDAKVVDLIKLPVLVAIIASAVSFGISPWVIEVLFGAQYRVASATVNLLALAVIPFSIVMIAARGLITVGLQRVDLYANLLGAIVIVVLCILLVRPFGAAGASAAQAATFSIMALFISAYLWHTRSQRKSETRHAASACILE